MDIPVLDRGQQQLFLALEMMEETALADPGAGADIVDRGGGTGPPSRRARLLNA